MSTNEGTKEEVPTMEITTIVKKKRCSTCNKKLAVLSFECRCQKHFCPLHRYPDQHNCTFDFKTHDQMMLKQTLTGGGAFAKLEKI